MAICLYSLKVRVDVVIHVWALSHVRAYILCRLYRRWIHPGRCIVECAHNHLFVEAPAVMGASFIWHVQALPAVSFCNILLPQNLFVTSCAGTSATRALGST